MVALVNALTSAGGGVVVSGDASGILQLQSNGTATVTVDTSGNVGIGTSSPSQKLTIQGTSNQAFLLAQDSTATVQGIYGADSVAGGAILGSLSNHPVVFRTNNTERARIDSSGNLLVNGTATFSPPGGDTPKIYSVGALAIKSGTNIVAYSSDRINFNAATYYVLGSATGGGVKLDNGTTAWAAQSDENTKDIIEPISNAVEKVDTLRAVIGKYKDDVDGVRRSFLIAQDVKSVLPEAVSTSSDGLLSLRYTEVIPLLVAAIQEQQALISSQAALITTLTERITALEAK